MISLILLHAMAFSVTQERPILKWRIDLRADLPVIGRSAAETNDAAKRLFRYENLQGDLPEAKPAPAATVEQRLREEYVLERLARWDVLAAYSADERLRVRDAAEEAVKQVRASDQLSIADKALEDLAVERALEDLGEKRESSPVIGAALIEEPLPLSHFSPLPTELQGDYVGLAEQLEGLQVFPVGKGPITKRAKLLPVPAGAFVRIDVRDAKPENGLFIVRYRLVSRLANRTELSVIDRWSRKGTRYNLVSTRVFPVESPDYAARAGERILKQAAQQHARIEERVRQQAAEAERLRKQREEADRLERERLRKDEEARRQEQERREQEERQRQQAEERQRQLEQAHRDLDAAQNNLRQAQYERDQTARAYRDAEYDRDRAVRDMEPYRRRVEDLRSQVRAKERELDDATRDKQGTAIIKRVLEELRDQLRGAESELNRARRQADDANNRVDSLRRAISDWDDRIYGLGNQISSLRSLISSLGG